MALHLESQNQAFRGLLNCAKSPDAMLAFALVAAVDCNRCLLHVPRRAHHPRHWRWPHDRRASHKSTFPRVAAHDSDTGPRFALSAAACASIGVAYAAIAAHDDCRRHEIAISNTCTVGIPAAPGWFKSALPHWMPSGSSLPLVSAGKCSLFLSDSELFLSE